MKTFTLDDIPEQTGRVAIVTGANTGIGFETAKTLALRGADVVLACRNADKGRDAVERILAAKPTGSARLGLLDLSDLDSVASFASTFAAENTRLDLLIDNAGVMVPPFSRTKQGFELQFGTNHLGHFALTLPLLPLLDKTPGSRVVVVSSTAQNFGRIDFDDLNWQERNYKPWPAYGQSKLANMMFTLELSRRLAAAGSKILVTAAHPGFTATDLQRTAGAVAAITPLVAMKSFDGALPTLRAAVDPSAKSGSYWGPNGLFELWGRPGPARVSKRALVEADAAKLFDVSERLTGVTLAKSLGATLRAAS
ncbi:MAG TPA: oxidoreductase [Polyangiaceae bacterium]|jgi:NAD(P)-dependent dehydrogenase (short-subunit alcohol dehydrogenase family)|nr:oxidoreductase [Polyangiaceae bacterium]